MDDGEYILEQLALLFIEQVESQETEYMEYDDGEKEYANDRN